MSNHQERLNTNNIHHSSEIVGKHVVFGATGRRTSAELAEFSSESAFLSGLFAGLLALLLSGLLLPWLLALLLLAGLPAVLRPTFVVLIHIHPQNWQKNHLDTHHPN
jgi:hypothetical protein